MNKSVVALYDDYSSAYNAVGELVDRGFPRETISLLSPEQSAETREDVKRMVHEAEKEGAVLGAGVVGAGIGATLGGIGGFLIGAGSLFIPGVGPVLAAGPLLALVASTGVGATVGGVSGGLAGVLAGMNIPEEDAHQYAEGVRRGSTLVSIRTRDDEANQAVEILSWYNPVNIDERADDWRQAGWTGFDPHDDSYPMSGEKNLPHPYPRDRPDDDLYQDDYDLPDDLELEDQTSSSPAFHIYQDYDIFEPSFRSHFESSQYYPQYTYDQFRPAYYYGYSLATDRRYEDRDWEDIEPEARRYWEDLEPGTWDRFKETVRDAWEEIKQTVQ